MNQRPILPYSRPDATRRGDGLGLAIAIQFSFVLPMVAVMIPILPWNPAKAEPLFKLAGGAVGLAGVACAGVAVACTDGWGARAGALTKYALLYAAIGLLVCFFKY